MTGSSGYMAGVGELFVWLLWLSAVGIEQNERWFDLSCRRIEEAYRQPRLFAEPVAKPVQQTFDMGAA